MNRFLNVFLSGKSNTLPFYILILITFFTMLVHIVKLSRLNIKIHIQENTAAGNDGMSRKKLMYLKRNLIIRTVLKAFAFIFLLLAACGITWGTYYEPVQNSSVSAALVFDISNSMNARDGLSNESRLKSASLFAKSLLKKASEICSANGHENPAVSVILAKGDGVTAIPLTQNYAAVTGLLEELNTNLMSAPGTNLAKGILEAKKSFSKNYASAGKIWVFTDGGETEGQLSGALAECIKDGIPVTVIGFGTAKGIDSFAGDGKTKIHTSLETEQILEAIKNAENKYPQLRNRSKLKYYDSSDKEAAVHLVRQISPVLGADSFTAEKISYEVHPVLRFKLFIALAVICFILNFILLELNLKFFEKKSVSAGSSLSSIVFTLMILSLFSGCSGNSKVNAADIRQKFFKGVYAFYQKQYDSSICSFLQAQEYAVQNSDRLVYEYAVFNLASAYIFKNEDAAAAQKLNQLYDLDIPLENLTPAQKELAYSVFYNSGILAHRNGNLEKAAEYFRKALETDSSKIQAKINLELSINQIQINARQSESRVTPASENNDFNNNMDNSFFERIKENDRKQWKNNSSDQNSNSAKDY